MLYCCSEVSPERSKRLREPVRSSEKRGGWERTTSKREAYPCYSGIRKGLYTDKYCLSCYNFIHGSKRLSSQNSKDKKALANAQPNTVEWTSDLRLTISIYWVCVLCIVSHLSRVSSNIRRLQRNLFWSPGTAARSLILLLFYLPPTHPTERRDSALWIKNKYSGPTQDDGAKYRLAYTEFWCLNWGSYLLIEFSSNHTRFFLQGLHRELN